jgi:outer membrane assembly lipoprotein YfiO
MFGHIYNICPIFYTYTKGKNMKYQIVYILILLILLAPGCARNRKSLANVPSEVKWQRAEAYFAKKKYHKAVPFYEQLVFERSSIYTADAQFKLGDCHFHRRKFADAIFEYSEFMRLFPDHVRAPDAQFQIGLAYTRLSMPPHFDQTESERAIDIFTIFSEKFPLDPRVSEAYAHIAVMQMRLITKTYQNGYIYYKMKDYPAAQLYLNEIIALGNRDDLERKAAFYNALIHIDRRESVEATRFIEHLRTHYPDSRELKSTERRFARMNSKIWHLLYLY